MAKEKMKVKVKVFDSLRESLQDPLAFESGQNVDLRVTCRAGGRTFG